MSVQLIIQKHKKKIAETKQLNTSNTMYLLLLQKKEQELAENENAIDRNEQLISEKIAEIEDLRKKLNAIHGGISDIDNKNNILDAPLVYRLHELASTSHKAKQNEIDEFVNIVKNAMPCFFEELGKRSKLSNTEVAICCLVKLNFITSEISCLSWGCTAIPSREGSQGLICLGMPSGCVELWIPCCSVSKTWTLEKVVLSLFFVIRRSPLWKLVLLLSKVSASTVTTGGTSFALVARMVLCTSLIWPLSIIRKCRC